MVSQNDVLTVAPDRKACFDGTVRVVAISDDGKQFALMRLDLPQPYAPFNRFTAEIAEGLDDESVLHIESFVTNLPASADELSKKKQEKLKANTALITPLMGDSLLILDSEYRGREFKRHAAQQKVHERTIRRLFYAYLWGGMTDLALAGPQKASNLPKAQQAPNTGRRGPKPRDPDSSSWIPLPKIRSKLEDGAKLYYLPGQYTQLEAFVLTQKKYFSRGQRATKNRQGQVKVEDILLPNIELPSIGQFRYICDLLEAALGHRVAKPRQVRVPRRQTVKRGNARRGTHGPGYRYEIDATRVQIRIVSRYSRRNLLREATLYIIIDVWSGAIVGYALSLDPASWALAAKALRNCFTDKTEVFTRLQLDYSASDWVARHLPTRLAADRAELVSNKAGVVPGLGIKVEIMASMCPERKGSVEAKFEAIKHSDNFYQKPGRHAKNPLRRENDGKKEAAYTLFELEQLIVEIIIDLNNDPVPIEYIPADAIKAGRSAITYGGLFEWGLKHRVGFTRTLPPKDVISSLWVRGVANVTAEGIHFKKQNFSSDALFDLGLPARAARNGAFEIEIRYDTHYGDEIWFLDTTTSQWKPAQNDNEQVARLKASFWELEDFLHSAEKLANEAKTENILRKDAKSSRLNKTADSATNKAKAAKAGLPKTQTKKHIANNTAVEVVAERLLQAKDAQASFASAIEGAKNDTTSGSSSGNWINETGISPPESIGNRSLALWRKMNGNLGK